MHKRFNEVLPYTYTITRKVDGKIYHGVRFKNVTKLAISPLNDLGIHYFGSSKQLKANKTNTSDFIFKVRHTFDTIEEALLYESKINRRLLSRPNFLNQGALLTNSSIGIKNPMFGKHHSSATKEKIRSTMKRRILDPTVYQKIAAANKGKTRTAIQRRNYSVGIKKSFLQGRVPWNKGKPGCYSAEVIQLQSERKRGSKNASYGKPAYKGNAFCGLPGAKNPRFGKKIMHNMVDKQQLVPINDIERFKQNGWMLGYLKQYLKNQQT